MKLQFEQLDLPSYIPDPTPTDVSAAIELYRTLMPPDYGKCERGKRALTLLELRMATTFITRGATSHDVLAVASLNMNYRLKGAAHLNGLVVHPEYQEHGIGRYTIDRLATVTADHGLDTLRLQPVPSALGFYAHLGFMCDEIVPVDPNRPFMSRSVHAALPERRQDIAA